MGGFRHAAACRLEGVCDEAFLEIADGLRERLIEADVDAGRGRHRNLGATARAPESRDVGRQVVRAEYGVIVGERDRAADFVGELADVARPVVEQQRGHEVVGEPHAGPSALGNRLREEERRERRDFVLAFAQRRQREHGDAEAVEQVLAEAALARECVEVGVGRRDETHRHAARTKLAERLNFATLEEPQQLRLCREFEVAHFIKEQRAAFG